MIEYRSIADLSRDIRGNLSKVPSDIGLVVGIPRSGILAATILALHLNLPLTDLNGLVEGRLIAGGKRSRDDRIAPGLTEKLKVLVLDDSVYSGEQMRKARAQIDAASLPHEVVFGAVYASPEGAQVVDFCFEILPRRRVFEWNVLHSAIVERSCVDIDGVLCRDPTDAQNDDGPQYLDFLVNAEPLFHPSFPIGWLVTCRLEKYRTLTEQWLAEHGVAYRELIMVDLPTKAARVAAGSHAKVKAGVYVHTGAQLFIESSARQAREIAARTGKPVYCLETGQLETGGALAQVRRAAACVSRWCYREACDTARRLVKLVHA